MTTAEYIALFELAIADGEKKLKIPSFPVAWNQAGYFFAHPSAIVEFVKALNFHPSAALAITNSTFGYNCYLAAMTIQPLTDTILNTKSFLTLGYINFQGDERFNFKDCILEWAEKPDVAARKRSDLHAWLTLSSGEIIDCALSFAIMDLWTKTSTGTPAERAQLINNPFIGTVVHLDAVRKVKYYPLGVGTDFARKIGL